MIINRLKELLLLCGILFSISTTNYAQTIRCYTDEMHAIRMQENQNLESKQEFEDWMAQKIQFNQSAMIIGGVYQIPVVVHVIHNGEAVGSGTNVSLAAIQSQIDVLNEDFRKMFGSNGWNTHPSGADTQIEFCLAKRRPDGSAFPNGEDGVNRINRSTAGFSAPPYSTAYIDATIKTYTYNNNTPTATRGWDPAKYMNIWLCNISGGILGYAQFPESSLGGMGCGTQSAATDGVVFLYSSIGKSAVTGFPAPYNEGRTATHEIGHWLGLRHIWGDGNCTVDDYCNDTPEASAANYGCTPNNSCTTTPDFPDMIENYMDYTDDLCMSIFTNDQKMRMRVCLESSPRRVSLINSDACVPPNNNDARITNIISPVGDHCIGSITPQVTLKNCGANNLTSATINYTIDGGTVTTFSWSGSITPGNSTSVTLPVFSTFVGQHTFKSWNTLPNGVVDPSPALDTSSIDFMVSNGIEAPYLETFENGLFPPNIQWVNVNTGNDCYEWNGASATSSAGVFENNAALFPGFGNSSAQTENLITPIFTLPCNATAANLQFDVAYRQRQTGANNRLYVEISQDCGQTWTSTAIYDKNGATLATVSGTQTTEFIPSAGSNWRTETVDLISFVGASSKNVKFRFRAVAVANGQNIWVDNIRLNATTPGEIDVTYNTATVYDGGSTNIGSVAVGSNLVATFTVSNSGSTNLTLTNPITVTGTGFTLSTGFGTLTVPAGGSTTFQVTFNSASGGTFTGNVSFANNDCDESPFNFQIQATATTTPPVADFSGSPTTICAGSSVTFTNLSTNASSYAWTFTGGTPSSSTATNPTITYNTPGTYAVSLVATNGFGNDTETKNAYITILSASGAALPYNEGFTSGATFPYTGWVIVNNNASSTWTRSNTVGYTPTAGNSLMFDNYNINDGDDDEAQMPGVDLSGLSAAQLTFDVAYARYGTSNFDGLEVLISTDCGLTFTSVYSKSNLVLATNGGTNVTSPFTPTSAQWRTETINLTPYIGTTKAIVSFRNLSGYGNRLFIDNINLTGTPGGSAPVASFTATPTTLCAGQTVNYTSTSTNNPSTFTWTFPGGTPSSSSIANPTVTYNTPGTYNVTLYVSNGSGNDTEVQNNYITVNALPTVNAGVDVSICNGSSTTLAASGASTYTWSPSTGLSATNVASPTASPTSTQTYTVTGTSAQGCINTDQVTVTVNALPVISNGGATNPSSCATSDGSIVVNGSGSGVVSWTGTASGNSGATTLPYTMMNLVSGSYTITFNNGTCTSTILNVSISAPSAPSAPVVTIDNQCGQSVLTTTGSNLMWSTGETTASITVTSGGTYTVTQTVGGCTSASGSGVASPLVAPSISAGATTGTSSCLVNDGSVVIQGSGTGNISWTGTAIGSNSNVSLPSTINGLAAGNYNFVFDNGCPSNSLSVTIAGASIPPAPVVTVDNQCGLSVLSATGSNLSWSTSETTSSITVTAAGNYFVSQTVGGCTSPVTNVSANPLTIPSVSLLPYADVCINTPAFALTGGSPSGGTYSGVGVSSGIFDPLVAGFGTFSITYTYTDVNTCSASASQMINVGCSSIEEVEAINVIVSPNPSNGVYHVSISEGEIGKLKLHDELGRLVIDEDVHSDKYLFDISNFAEGVYTLHLEINDQVKSYRIVMIK